MTKLEIPKDEDDAPLVAGDVFATCISVVRDRDLKARLTRAKTIVERKSEIYDEKATDSRLYQLRPHAAVGEVTDVEMIKVYTGRMVPKGRPGRPYYDRIFSKPVHGRCPFCGIGTVNTLDHYLPKTHFPVFSVTPNNLVPACSWCQGEKGEYFPRTKADQIIHPYFDDFGNETWLSANVVQGFPAAFRYFVSAPEAWDETDGERLKTHLRELNLYTLFSSNAGSRLSEIRGRLNKLHQLGGATAVRSHLEEECESIEEAQKNSWQAAMYRAAYGSDWFCDGGFA